jgi:hypothetical protein
VDIRFSENIFTMGFHGSFADKELVGNLFVGQIGGNTLNDFYFPNG